MAALGVSLGFGKLLLKELGFVTIRKGEERVNCQEAAGKVAQLHSRVLWELPPEPLVFMARC